MSWATQSRYTFEQLQIKLGRTNIYKCGLTVVSEVRNVLGREYKVLVKFTKYCQIFGVDKSTELWEHLFIDCKNISNDCHS